MRKQGWETELENYIDATKQEKFVWGKCDCILWSCKFASIITDKDPAAGSYAAYDDEESAYAHLKEVYGDVKQGLDKHYERVEPSFRQRADLALCMLEGRETLGIVGANGFIFFKKIGRGVIAKKGLPIIAVWRTE